MIKKGEEQRKKTTKAKKNIKLRYHHVLIFMSWKGRRLVLEKAGQCDQIGSGQEVGFGFGSGFGIGKLSAYYRQTLLECLFINKDVVESYTHTFL